MSNVERVINGLECCLPMTTRNGLADCKQCPYDRKITLEGGVTECCHDLMTDAIALLKALYAFKSYFDDLYGQGLDVANYHLNGATEPFDNFYDSAMEEYENARCD